MASTVVFTGMTVSARGVQEADWPWVAAGGEDAGVCADTVTPAKAASAANANRQRKLRAAIVRVIWVIVSKKKRASIVSINRDM